MADRQMQYARAYTDDADRAYADDGPGTPISFTASTPGVKRDGLDLRASGWLTDHYRQSPVVLWCHNHTEPPIGTADAVVEATRLRMPVTFDQEDPFAVRIESKVRRRIIRACSVGWDFVDQHGDPLAWWRMSPDQITNEAYYDLTELSIVPVGADPLALSERRRSALRSLSRELAALYDEQERPDSRATADEVRVALHDELVRLGIDLNDVKALLRRDRAAIPPHNTRVVESEWDGPAAVAACPAEAGPLRAIHAWVDSDGDPDAKSSYKLPHHAEPGGPANLNGVRNALARLPQANIPDADRDGVERHLRTHLDAQDDDDRGGDNMDDEDSAARAAAVDQDAARLVLAAFGDL